MIRLAMAGAAGKMGKTILGLAIHDKEFKITAGLESKNNSAFGKDIGQFLGAAPLGAHFTHDLESLKSADVLVDFTHPSATQTHLKSAVQYGLGYVIGTTGLDEATLALIKKASAKIPIVQSPNMSIGVNLLFGLAELTAKTLDETYNIEISEIHHRMKKDAPSGTAVKLLEILAAARSRNLKKDVVTGRSGEVGARPQGEIGVFALRGGDVVGEHTVFFFGDGERIELTHKASSREAFAQGALRAAKFIAKKKNGLYNMRQVLDIA